MRRVPLSRPFVNDEIKEAAIRVIDSGKFILSRECEAFERELAAYTGRKHAVLCSSLTAGTLLLHKAMRLRPGDEVLAPSLTAFPSIEPMLHCGARPVFVDVDETFCMDPDALEAAVTPRTVGIVVVHLYGHAVDLDPVLAVARRHRLWVIEDCAQALGASYRGRRVGSYGFAAGLSFFPSKNLTVLGDGGCICTDDAGVADEIRMLRNHGRRDKHIHELVGFNLRFNEIQAAVGRVALRHLDALNDGRRRVAARYRDHLDGLVELPIEEEWTRAVYHLFVIRVARRDDLARHLRDCGVETGIHYPVPLHQQPAVRGILGKPPVLPATERAVREILSLPIYGDMADSDVDHVIGSIRGFASRR